MDASPARRVRRLELYQLYLILVSLLGGLLVLLGFLNFPADQPKVNFFLLLSLAIAVQLSATSFSKADKTGVTYVLGPAVTLAAVPAYGPATAALLEAAAVTAMWAIKPAEEKGWKKSWRQLAFNVGMSSASIYVAGVVLLALRQLLGAGTLVGATLPWLAAAVTNDQVNLWLLIGILYLQSGGEAKPLQIWKENVWAIPIGILSISVGGGLLAYALARFDWLGVIIFFLPVFLSSFAYRLYVRQMQEHMNDLEKIVAERTQELKELMEQKDAFLAVLTHDMKTPLTSIGLYAEMIERRPQIVIEKPHVVQMLLRSQKTLSEIFNNVLDLEKMQANQSIALACEEFDLVPVVEYLVEAIAAQAEQKDIALHLRREVDAIQLKADRQQIERVVNNLLSNAIKYTPQGGRVEVTIGVESERALLQVADTGYGIPADELPHIFEPYRRVRRHKDKASGTGLGLAITRVLVEAHEGEIEVASEEDQGSTFKVRLPMRRPA